jgi:DNA-binding NarL/FixJ family response regulator
MNAVAVAYEAEPASAKPTGVLIADDHPLMLAGIRRTLEHTDDIEVVGEAGTGPQVLAMIERRCPDVVLLDLHMPGAGGSEFVGAVARDWPGVKVVVLSAHDDQASIDGALDAGASAYMVKRAQTTDLPSVIRQVAGGNVFHATPRRAPTPAPETETSALTERERTILCAVASGSTTAAISKELWVSEHTIKFHLTNIYRKLGVNNRAAAIRYALEHGICN